MDAEDVISHRECTLRHELTYTHDAYFLLLVRIHTNDAHIRAMLGNPSVIIDKHRQDGAWRTRTIGKKRLPFKLNSLNSDCSAAYWLKVELNIAEIQTVK